MDFIPSTEFANGVPLTSPLTSPLANPIRASPARSSSPDPNISLFEIRRRKRIKLQRFADILEGFK
jgi:hypothetical protein